MTATAEDARTVDELLKFILDGGQPEYLLFWGLQPPATGGAGKGCLSQWWPAPFTVDGISYQSAEHFMMTAKALLFGDASSADRIRAAPHPRAAKALGREVRGFDDQRWAQRRFDLVVTGNLAKFSQHPDLRDYLLGTGNRVIVEASPVDRIWGIGLAADDKRATSPEHWSGLNLLGFALMEVRQQLRSPEPGDEDRPLELSRSSQRRASSEAMMSRIKRSLTPCGNTVDTRARVQGRVIRQLIRDACPPADLRQVWKPADHMTGGNVLIGRCRDAPTCAAGNEHAVPAVAGYSRWVKSLASHGTRHLTPGA